MPRSNGLGPNVGFAGRPSTNSASAVSSPATNAPGAPSARTRTRPSTRLRARTSISFCSAASSSSPAPPNATSTSCAPDCLCSEDGTVEDDVRGVAEQHPVLAACRLALDAVDDHAAAAALGDCRQLARGWETAAAAAGQSALRRRGRSGRRRAREGAPSGRDAPRVRRREQRRGVARAAGAATRWSTRCRAHWLFSPLSSEDVSGAAWIVPVTLREPASMCSRMTSRSVEPDEEVTSAVTSVPCSPTTEPE